LLFLPPGFSPFPHPYPISWLCGLTILPGYPPRFGFVRMTLVSVFLFVCGCACVCVRAQWSRGERKVEEGWKETRRGGSNCEPGRACSGGTCFDLLPWEPWC
uniref:FXYD domain-containing ion transport regulator n=1 Tax=Esox lucius TaxID=8010 RepID=A0AAY5L4W0_ESOLU